VILQCYLSDWLYENIGHETDSGFAAAKCGKAVPFRSGPLFFLRPERSLGIKGLRCRKATGFPRCAAVEPQAYNVWQMPLTDELKQKLRALDAEFDREMRARGFDPAQAENVALPSHLDALYAEREGIKAELEDSEVKIQ
jgi:hypothetical protein